MSPPAPSPPIHPTLVRIARSLPGLPGGIGPAYVEGWLHRHRAAITPLLHRSLPRLKLVELFAGIGGLGSGLERALGAVTILQAEGVAERRRILHRHFPLALQVDDVHDLLDMSPPDDPDSLVVAGGFPCRGASRANVRGPRGLAHPGTGLWSVFSQVIHNWQPALVIWENVTPLRSRGMVQVLADLDHAGYNALWGVLKASDFGAPHERARIFCIARRRSLTPMEVLTHPPRTAWLPWESPIPQNDPHTPGRAARVTALGDAVLPIAAWTVGTTAARMLAGWWPTGARSNSAPLPPTMGTLINGEISALPSSPYVLPNRSIFQRFVTIDEHSENPGACGFSISPPLVGRVLWESSEQVDVELPGGDVQPFPASWARDLWPTPTANDGRNRGAASQWRRHQPGLNVLAQANTCPRDEWAVGEALVDLFAGQGLGPGLAEWVMGFPLGWTG